MMNIRIEMAAINRHNIMLGGAVEAELLERYRLDFQSARGSRSYEGTLAYMREVFDRELQAIANCKKNLSLGERVVMDLYKLEMEHLLTNPPGREFVTSPAPVKFIETAQPWKDA